MKPKYNLFIPVEENRYFVKSPSGKGTPPLLGFYIQNDAGLEDFKFHAAPVIAIPHDDIIIIENEKLDTPF